MDVTGLPIKSKMPGSSYAPFFQQDDICGHLMTSANRDAAGIAGDAKNDVTDQHEPERQHPALGLLREAVINAEKELLNDKGMPEIA